MNASSTRFPERADTALVNTDRPGPLPGIDREAVRRILVVKLRAVGDVLLATIVLRNLRRAFPSARLDFLTEPPARDVVNRHPDVDEVLTYDRTTESGAGLIRRVRSRSYDLILDLFGNPRTALVTRLSGAHWRVGYRFRGRSYAYNIVVTPRGGVVHNTQFNLDALEAIGVAIVDRNLYFPIASAEEQAAAEVVDRAELRPGRIVALNTGGGWYTKRWPLERFAALGDRLAEAYGVGIVLPWGPGQRQEVETVRAVMKHPVCIPPSTTLGELGALLKRMSLVISNDSGPMHLAAAVGTPVLGIFGPTNPVLQGPYGPGHAVIRNEAVTCLGCNLTACPIHHPCMKELSVDTVFEAAGALITRTGMPA
jgi:ADP-heptose:LPS heptosyltransferase